MENGWWPYMAWFLVTYGGYPAGCCHPNWKLLVGTIHRCPAAAAATLPSHYLGTYIFINGLLHTSFKQYDPVWCLEAGHFPDPCISLVLIPVKADCWSACSYRLILPKTSAPDNLPPYFPPTRSCLATPLVIHPLLVCVAPSFQIFFPGTRNKSTALDLRCRMTLEAGIVFLKYFIVPGVIWLMSCFSSSASSISQISCAVQRMKTIIKMPLSVLPFLSLVRRWICIFRCLPQHHCQTTPGCTVCWY